MNILYILSKGLNQPDLTTLQALELQDQYPRTTYLERSLGATVLDERWLSNVSGMRGALYKWLPITLSQIIEGYLLSKNTDVIFSHTEKVGLPLGLLLKWSRIKTPHLLTIWRITSANALQAKWKALFLRLTADYFTSLLIWSSNQRRIVCERFPIDPKRVHWIRYGVDLNFWRPMKQKETMICSVGMEMRDYPTLVKALQGTSIRCHIATGQARGELFDTVRRLYQMRDLPSGLSIGQKNYLQLRQLYAKSRFVVIPLLETDSDNGLTTIVEAMAMGKAVICSRVEGQIDLIEDGVNGILVPQGDIDALQEAMLSLWNDPKRARKLGDRAREFIETHHSLEQSLDQVVQLVKQAAVGSPVFYQEPESVVFLSVSPKEERYAH